MRTLLCGHVFFLLNGPDSFPPTLKDKQVILYNSDINDDLNMCFYILIVPFFFSWGTEKLPDNWKSNKSKTRKSD